MSKVFRSKDIGLLMLGLAVITFLYLIVMLVDPKSAQTLTANGAIVDYWGALFFLESSLIYLFLFCRHKPGNDLILFQTERNIFYLFLAIGLFVGFGEEIKWGQYIFNLETPEAFRKLNYQHEIGVHNIHLGWVNIGFGLPKRITTNSLFRLCVFVYCVALPILMQVSSWIHRNMKRLNVPIIPFPLAILFVFVLLVPRVAYSYFSPLRGSIIREFVFVLLMPRAGDPLRGGPVAEMEEFNIELLLLVGAVYFLKQFLSVPDTSDKSRSPG